MAVIFNEQRRVWHEVEPVGVDASSRDLVYIVEGRKGRAHVWGRTLSEAKSALARQQHAQADLLRLQIDKIERDLTTALTADIEPCELKDLEIKL